MVERSRLLAALGEKIQGWRYDHSLRVAETAVRLAGRFGAGTEAAERVGLMHDYAKFHRSAELLSLAERSNLVQDPAERAVPDLLHGPVGALLLQDAGLVTSADELHAIAVHTTGAPGMSKLAQVLWVADYIEPGRSFPGVESVRALAESDLLSALRVGLEQTMHYVLHRGWILHAQTVHARNWVVTQQSG